MKRYTTAAEAVLAVNNNPCDAACKKILSNRAILAWILKDCVEEYANYTLEEIASCIESEPEVSTVVLTPDLDDCPNISGMGNSDSKLRDGLILTGQEDPVLQGGDELPAVYNVTVCI